MQDVTFDEEVDTLVLVEVLVLVVVVLVVDPEGRAGRASRRESVFESKSLTRIITHKQVIK